MEELKPKSEEVTKEKRTPVEMLECEALVTRSLLKHLLLVMGLWGVLIAAYLTQVLSIGWMIVCALGGVVALYLSNHAKLYQLIERLDLDWNRSCFFDEEMVESLMNLNCIFFREVSLFLIGEPFFKQIEYTFPEDSVWRLVVGLRWILFGLILVKDVFYFAITSVMSGVQKEMIADLRELPTSIQWEVVEELRMHTEELDQTQQAKEEASEDED